MKDAILMPHGFGPFVSRKTCKVPEPIRINAVRLFNQNRTGQHWDKPVDDEERTNERG